MPITSESERLLAHLNSGLIALKTAIGASKGKNWDYCNHMPISAFSLYFCSVMSAFSPSIQFGPKRLYINFDHKISCDTGSDYNISALLVFGSFSYCCSWTFLTHIIIYYNGEAFILYAFGFLKLKNTGYVLWIWWLKF